MPPQRRPKIRPWLSPSVILPSIPLWCGACSGGAPRAVDTGAVSAVVALDAAPAAAPSVAAPAAGRVPAPSPGGAVVERGGFKTVHVQVRGSLAGSIAGAVPGEGSVLAAHLGRVFMWDLDLRRDVLPGDEVSVVWHDDAAGGLELVAAVYQAKARGQALRAYRFKAPSDEYASYWDETGEERARRLVKGPLRDYEQITALLKDRPTHQGMDFKTPIGTPVQAPRAGVVTRVDWKLSGNGHCVELRYDDGVIAKFLHLSARKVSPGARVQAGQIIALTGNTGHSTAPHLHYQLARGARTLDPVDYHGTARRRLDAAGRRGLAAVVATMDPLLKTAP